MADNYDNLIYAPGIIMAQARRIDELEAETKRKGEYYYERIKLQDKRIIQLKDAIAAALKSLPDDRGLGLNSPWSECIAILDAALSGGE